MSVIIDIGPVLAGVLKGAGAFAFLVFVFWAWTRWTQ